MKVTKEAATDRDMKEVQILKELDHPNIIKLEESFINDKDQLVQITEFATGGSLFDNLEVGKIYPEITIIRWMLDISKGIQYLHSKNIIHRDISPDNVLIF